MMRIALLSLVLPALLAAGCVQKADVEELAMNVAEAGGLKVQVQLPGRQFQTGEKLRVTVTATNTTKEPIHVVAPSGAPVLVRITRHTALSAEEVKYYPQSATTNIHSWSLPAKQSRKFVLMVPVEPDWPVGEVLHVSAELNGLPKLSPSVYVVVAPPRK